MVRAMEGSRSFTVFRMTSAGFGIMKWDNPKDTVRQATGEGTNGTSDVKIGGA
jgi:hypothetical protein